MINTHKFLQYRQKGTLLVWLLLLSLLVAACSDNGSTVTTGVTPTASASITAGVSSPTRTATPPTVTPLSPTQTATLPTATPPTVTPTPTSQSNKPMSSTVGQLFPALATSLPEQATKITITDNYSSIGPGYDAGYSLNRTGNSFTGSASITSYSTKQTIKLAIVMPANVTKDFLQSLAQVPLEEGKYTPYLDHTDDYPDISYQVETPNGVLDFYTNSQNKLVAGSLGDYNLPWGFTFAGRDFTINSPLASQALAKLSPYLHQEVLKQALDGNPLTPAPAPTSTP